jgi:hypothetical protein
MTLTYKNIIQAFTHPKLAAVFMHVDGTGRGCARKASGATKNL